MNPRKNERILVLMTIIISLIVINLLFQNTGIAFPREKPEEFPVYLNPQFSIDQRVEDLLSRMTLEEKIGQINTPAPQLMSSIRGGDEMVSKSKKWAEGYQKMTSVYGTSVTNVGPVGGFFAAGRWFKEIEDQVGFFNELQRIAVEETRLGIPLIFAEEGVHGLLSPYATIFPEGLALGSTWNMDLIEQIFEITARESRTRGVHVLATLVVEPNRDPRMGRNIEAFSEDPYFCSRVAEAMVRGAQGDDLTAYDKAIAMLTHFPGQTEPVSGMERGAMEISERKLREVFLPPYITGITKAGSLAVMAAYPAIDGEAIHGSEKLLTQILREELGFQGIVFSEGAGIGTLVYEGTVATQKEAGAMAIKAGVDASIYIEDGYLTAMYENVLEGKVSIETLDRAVRRILRVKFLLGLFENPYVNVDIAKREANTKGNRELALQAAREGIVLLKNENNLLPLDKNKIKSVAVIGPNADDEINQLGDYVSKIIPQEIVTVLKGVKNKVSPETKVVYVKGCEVIGNELNEINKAVKAAKKADIAIVVVGESDETSAEAIDVASLNLTGLQEDLLKAVHATGTPTIAVLISGRPLSITWTAENIPAIVQPWFCGEEGGNAVADVLFGDYNPCGRLPVTVPRHVGQLPVYYNYMPSKKHWLFHGFKKPYADMSPFPLYEFGFGLSYTTYEYSNIQITPKEIDTTGEVYISVDVKNTGKREGNEVVQLYINDVISSLSTPIKELKGFEKINLRAGEKKTVEFKLTPEHISLINMQLETVVEPGLFKVMVGSSSEDIRLKGEFKVN